MKNCKQCGELKALDDYYAHPDTADRKSAKCVECVKENARANRAKNIEYYREYDRNRGGGRWSQEYLNSMEYRDSCSRSNKKYRKQNPHKYKAHSAVSNAVRDGRLEKPGACETCDDTGVIHGHHDDYAYPLEVRWLCAACHRQWHMKHGEAKHSKQEQP